MGSEGKEVKHAVVKRLSPMVIIGKITHEAMENGGCSMTGWDQRST